MGRNRRREAALSYRSTRMFPSELAKRTASSISETQLRSTAREGKRYVVGLPGDVESVVLKSDPVKRCRHELVDPWQVSSWTISQDSTVILRYKKSQNFPTISLDFQFWPERISQSCECMAVSKTLNFLLLLFKLIKFLIINKITINNFIYFLDHVINIYI